MQKLNKAELVSRLFGLPRNGVSEHDLAIAKHTAELILRDLTAEVQIAWEQLGPGILVIRRIHDDVLWSTASELMDLRAQAERQGDESLAEAFADLLTRLSNHDPGERSLIAIAGLTDLRVVNLDNDDPSRQIEEYLDAWNG
jgi:hypothetical protein